MQVVNQTHKVEDRNLLVITHLCQLLTYITGFGGLIAPLVIWASKKDTVVDMDIHGKQIINFQLSLIVYALISIPLILALGLGILLLIGVGVIGLIMPIINAINASNGELPNTFGTIPFLK